MQTANFSKRSRIVYSLTLVLLCLPLIAIAQAGLDTLQLSTIFHEPFLAGSRPSFISFSPNDKQISFRWNEDHKSASETYTVDRDGKNITRAGDDARTNFTLSPNKKHLFYVEKGDLYIADVNFKNIKQITNTPDVEYNARWSMNSKRLAFVSNGDVWVIDLDSPAITRVTKKKEDEPNFMIAFWVGNNDQLMLQQYDNSDVKEIYFPEYADKFVKPGNSKRGLNYVTLSQFSVDTTGNQKLLEGKIWAINLATSHDGRYLVIDYLDADMKSRTAELYDLIEKTNRTIFQDSTQGWISMGSSDLKFIPDSYDLIIQSEKDGWAHLYRYSIPKQTTEQLTKGSFEVSWFDFVDEKTMVIVSSEVNLGERHIYHFDLKKKSIKKLTTESGYRQNFNLSHTKNYLVYEKTYWNEPHDLYLLNVKKPGKEVKLTHTTPELFKTIEWQTPEYWRFTGRDGETDISMTLLKPLYYTPEKEYPVVVFVHGAGSLQNVYPGWSNHYYREYMFHQYLNVKGFFVVEIDYRHSTGYGRKFREDVTNWMGKYETEDIEDGLDYAQSKLGNLDLNRVGIYGGSYGGFMALYAVSVSPDRFHAAAALRAVTNWENYYYANPWYTQPRLGTPERDPEHYKRSSPLTYADSLKRPVYILHGLMDNNVGFQDAVQYVEKLIQSGNTRFDMMLYPTERHSFRDPDAWFDEYRRIDTFFERELLQK